MRLKRFMAFALSTMMVASLVACTSPKDLIGKIFLGKGNNGPDVLAEASVINKDAVFQVNEEFQLGDSSTGYGYEMYSLKYANGNIWGVKTTFVNEGGEAEYDDEYDVMPLDVKEPAVGEEFEETEDPDGVGGEDFDYYEPDMYEGYSSHIEIQVVSFTNSGDIEYYAPIVLGSDEYLSSAEQFEIDRDNNIYIVASSYKESGEEYFLRKYDSNGNLLQEVKMQMDNVNDWFYVGGMAMDANNNIYILSNSCISIYDSSFKLVGRYDYDSNNSWISGLVTTQTGDVIFGLNSWVDDKNNWTLFKLASNGDASELPGSAETFDKEIYGGGGYDIYFTSQTSVRAMGINDKVSVEIMNFNDSDVNPYDFRGAVFIDKETFVSSSFDNDGNQIVSVYKKVPADQVIDKEIITLAANGLDFALSKQINVYNKQSTKYKIKLVDYSTYNTEDDYTAGVKRFNSDLTSGKSADIIVPGWGTDIKNLMNKGVFADLTPYMEAGNGVKKSDLVYNAQHMYADGEKLYCVFPSFYVTCFEVKKSLYDGELSMDDILAWEAKTGNKAFSSDNVSQSILNQLLVFSMDSFLDPTTGKCNFDSPEFIALLEYAKSYPAELPEDYWDNYDYMSYMTNYRSDKNLVYNTSVSNLRDYNWHSQEMFGTETALTGLKLGNGQGANVYTECTLGISAKSKNKEAAWDFIASCFTDSYYEQNSWDFPSLDSKFDERIKEATKKPFYTDENGNKVEYDETFWLIDHEEVVEPLTEAKGMEIKDFVTHIDSSYYYDDELMSIIFEETDGYFKGQKKAEEVAKIIQSRLQIYVNEKR